MKRYNLIFGLIVMMFFAACSGKDEKAGRYNDEIISYQESIVSALDMFDSLLRDTNSTEDRLEYAYARLQSSVKLGILALDSIGPFQKDPSLQLAARDLFRDYEKMIDQDYKKLLEVKLLPQDQITNVIADTTYSIQQRIHTTSKVSQSRFIGLQAEFGKKYHLELE